MTIIRGDRRNRGGTIHGCPMEFQNGGLSFLDRVTSGLQAVAARKVLVPAQGGFVERLEFNRGLGLLETYYTMLLRRRHEGAYHA